MQSDYELVVYNAGHFIFFLVLTLHLLILDMQSTTDWTLTEIPLLHVVSDLLTSLGLIPSFVAITDGKY